MKTFFNILQTIINKQIKTYPDEPFCFRFNNEPYKAENSYIDYMISVAYYSIQKNKFKDYYIKNATAKFLALNNMLTNSFIKSQLKEQIFDIFSKAQKYYFAFTRLTRLYKVKHYPFIVTDDLTLNPLDPTHKNTFLLIENKSKYLFNLNELISIIETAIGHAPNFFTEPLSPLNPYNNQKFTNATLYNIYFKMKESSRLISELFHFFFLEHFNKSEFAEHYEPFLRENAIKKYAYNSPYTVLYSSIVSMLNSHYCTRALYIHKDFPKELLVDIFRPFLFYFFIVNYDIKGTNKIYKYKQMLYIKLKKFYEFNPAFGRQYIQTTLRPNRTIKTEYKFNTKHINFYDIPISNNISHINNYFINTISILLNSNTHNVNEDEDDDSVNDSVNDDFLDQDQEHEDEDVDEYDEQNDTDSLS